MPVNRSKSRFRKSAAQILMLITAATRIVVSGGFVGLVLTSYNRAGADTEQKSDIRDDVLYLGDAKNADEKLPTYAGNKDVKIIVLSQSNVTDKGHWRCWQSIPI